MATKKTTENKQQRFSIYSKITLDTSIEIAADSLEDAVAKSKSLIIDDFIDIHGEHNDSTVEIVGFFKA